MRLWFDASVVETLIEKADRSRYLYPSTSLLPSFKPLRPAMILKSKRLWHGHILSCVLHEPTVIIASYRAKYEPSRMRNSQDVASISPEECHFRLRIKQRLKPLPFKFVHILPSV